MEENSPLARATAVIRGLMGERAKIFFELAPDEDGYPPVTTESMWALKPASRDGYELDNIPFFAREATLGDIVAVRSADGVLWFDHLLERSGNSLLRVVLFEPDLVAEVRRAIAGLGCETEFDATHRLLAVNVPANAPLAGLQAYLAKMAAAESLDYEEAILRQ